jgi:hypothetical protein
MNETPPRKPPRQWALGLCFIVGMTAFALLLGRAAREYKRMDEFVTVKGLSEREMPADLIIWPLTFSVSDDDLGKLQEQMQKARSTVHQFLQEAGFQAAEISNSPPNIKERSDDPVEGRPKSRRFQANATVLLRTTNIAKAKAAMETCDKLVQQGVVLSGGDYMSKPQFLFTGLNQIKPAMIQEANRNARTAAEKFAEDSASRIGAIRHAVQGPFEVNELDSSTPDRKIVRVVTTVDFYLK